MPKSTISWVLLAGGLLVASDGAAQQGEDPGRRGPRGDRGARQLLLPMDQGRENLTEEERELTELREQMRALRSERREAMRSARDSGDPAALSRVQDDFRPRMEELRERMRGAREVVVEARLRENPELAQRLAGRGASRDRIDCSVETGQADEATRRRAFQRLQGIAPDLLNEPMDIPTPLRQELQTYARRSAILQCVRARARAAGDAESAQRARELMRADQRRHHRAIRELLGAPRPTGRQGSAGDEAMEDPEEADSADEETES